MQLPAWRSMLQAIDENADDDPDFVDWFDATFLYGRVVDAACRIQSQVLGNPCTISQAATLAAAAALPRADADARVTPGTTAPAASVAAATVPVATGRAGIGIPLGGLASALNEIAGSARVGMVVREDGTASYETMIRDDKAFFTKPVREAGIKAD